MQCYIRNFSNSTQPGKHSLKFPQPRFKDNGNLKEVDNYAIKIDWLKDAGPVGFWSFAFSCAKIRVGAFACCGLGFGRQASLRRCVRANFEPASQQNGFSCTSQTALLNYASQHLACRTCRTPRTSDSVRSNAWGVVGPLTKYR